MVRSRARRFSPLLEHLEARELLNGADDRFYLARLYEDLLERPVDAGGLGFWSNNLSSDGRRDRVALAFTSTGEYQQKLVERLYRGILRRDADQGGQAFFVSSLQTGATVPQIESLLLGSSEYFDKQGGGTNEGFLTALYRDSLGRDLDAGGRTFWVGQLGSGASRQDVALAIRTSVEGNTRQVQDLYQQYLRRPADAGGATFFAAALGQGARVQDVTAQLVGSDEYLERQVRSLRPSERFLSTVYQDVLGRPLDSGGLGFWTGVLDQNAPLDQVAAAITRNDEYRARVVTGLYSAVLRRAADDGGRAFFVSALAGGATVEQVQAQLLGSTEYFDKQGNNGTDGFLTALYRDALGRSLDSGGQAFWTAQLTAGTTRSAVALSILTTPEALGRTVQDQYQQILHRPADAGGLQFFVAARLGGARQEDVLAALLGAPEYITRRVYDRQAPALEIISPASGGTSEQPPLLSGRVTDDVSGLARLEAQLDNTAFAAVSVDAEGRFTFTPATTVPGTHTVRFRAIDQAGNTSTVTEFVFTLQALQPQDTQAPVITIEGPAAGTMTDRQLTIVGRVADQGSGVATLQVQVDSQAFRTLTFATDGRFTFTTDLPLNGSADGSHVVRFRATDQAGNTSGFTELPFTLASLQNDTQPPTITVQGPAANVLTNQNPTVTGRVLDNLSGVAQLQAQVDAGAFVAVAVNAAGDFTFTPQLPLNGSADGTHVVRLRATDRAGNVSATSELSFTLDTVAPADPTFDFAPNAGSTQTTVASVTLSGRTSPLTTVSLVGRNQSVTADANGDFVLANVPLVLGDNVLTLEAADAAGNRRSVSRTLRRVAERAATVTKFEPLPGEEAVSIKREGIVRFSRAIDPATVDSGAVQFVIEGQPVPGRLVVGSNNLFVTFFPTTPWPASTAVQVRVDGNRLRGMDGQLVDADGDGTPGGVATSEFRTISLTRVPDTRLFGFVYDSNRKNPDGSDIPIVGVRIEVEGIPDLVVVTDSTGRFEVPDAPAPVFFVNINGTQSPAPAGFHYPAVRKPFHSVAGNLEQLNMMGVPFNVYLPLIKDADMTPLLPGQETNLVVKGDALSQLERMFPDKPAEMWQNLTVKIPHDSIYFDDGKLATLTQIIVLPTDRIPAPVLPGMEPAFVWSVDGNGAQNFTEPASITYPNIDNLAPGEKRSIYYFDHDAGHWDISGTMTVTPDGKMLVSDPGSGIRTLGWRYVPKKETTPADPCMPAPNPTMQNMPQPEVKESGFLFLDKEVGDHFFYKDEENYELIFRNKAPKRDPNPFSDPCSEENKQETPLVFEIMTSGSESRFLKQALKGKKITLYPQQEQRIKIDLKELAKEERLKGLEEDELYGVRIDIKAYKQSEPSKILLERTSFVYRFVDVADDNHTDGKVEFADTALNGVERKRPLKNMVDGPAQPDLKSDDQATFPADKQQLSFNPASIGEHTGSIKVMTPQGGEAGFLNTRGIGQEQKIYFNTANLERALADLYNRSLDVDMGKLDRNKVTYADQAEQKLIDTPEERSALASSIVTSAMSVLSSFSAGIQYVGGADGEAIRVETWDVAQCTLCDKNTGVIGLSQTLDNGIDPGRSPSVSEVLKERTKRSKPEMGFRLSRALNETPGAHIDMYVDRIFDGYLIFKPEEVAKFVGEISAHEIGHNIGLSHISSSVSELIKPTFSDDDVRLARVLRFTTSADGARVALGTNWDTTNSEMALDYFGKAAGTKKAEGQFIDRDEDIIIGGPLLYVVDAASDALTTSLDLGNVLADGVGNSNVLLNLEIRNIGEGDLVVNNVIIQGGDGYIVPTIAPGTIIPGKGALTFPVRFDPQRSGRADLLMRLVSNSLAGDYTLQLSGTGQSPTGDLQVSVANNNVGGLALSAPALTTAGFATVTNQGAGNLTITDIRPDPLGIGQFTVANLPVGFGPGNPIVLTPGQSFTFDLVFNASQVGLQRGAILIASDDPDTPVFRQAVVGTGLPDSGTALDVGHDFVSINVGSGVMFRARSDGAGGFKVFLPANQPYELTAFDPVSGLVWSGLGTTAAAAQRTDLGVPTFAVSTAPDSDGDGLPDDAETAIGTSPSLRDTDHDGIDDFAEIVRGLDALDGRTFPTGVIAQLDTLGNTTAVSIANNLAYVGTTDGLTIVDATQLIQPIILGRAAIVGGVATLSVDPTVNIAAVVTTGNELRFVNVADPMRPAVLRSIPAARFSVAEAFNGVVYAANSLAAELRTYDLQTGDLLQTLPLPSGISLLTRSGTFLYGRTSSGLLVIDITNEGSATVVGELGINALGGATDLFAANGIVYQGLGSPGSFFEDGLTTVDVSDPAHPVLISKPDSAFNAFHVALNGSGLGLFTSRLLADPVRIYNVSAPQDTASFVFEIPTPGIGYDLAITRGIALVADGPAGLLALNYLPFDTKGSAPTVALRTPLADEDPGSAGFQVTEGTFLPIVADVTDDVQASYVELFVNGELLGRDTSFPWEFFVPAPAVAAGPFSVQARAFDTGGNSTLSSPLTFQLRPDTASPTLLSSYPASGSGVNRVTTLRLNFSESLDTTRLAASGVHLVFAGADGLVGTPDDTAIALASVAARNFGRTILITPQVPLEFDGSYRLTVDRALLADRAGNQPAADLVLDFQKTPDALPLPFDVTVNGELGEEGEQDLYIFTAAAGQYFFLDGQDDFVNRKTVRLTSPSGLILLNETTGVDSSPIFLPDGGIYRLSISGEIGSYKFRATLPTRTTTPLNLDAVINGSITKPGEVDVYTFTATVGQRLYFDGRDGSAGQNAVLLGPSGFRFFNSVSDTAFDADPFAITESGSYRLEIGGEVKTGNYQFRLLDVANAPVLPLGQETTIALDPAAASAVYRFDGVAGQRLFFDHFSTFGNIIEDFWQVWGPGNQRLGGNSLRFNKDFEQIIPADGPYLLVFQGNSLSSGVVMPHFRVTEPPTTTQPLTLGQVINGTLDEAGERQVYTFQGTAGQRLYFDYLDPQNAVPFTRFLRAPGDATPATGLSVGDSLFTLDETGTYQVIFTAADSSNQATLGSYSFRLLDVATLPLVTPGQTVTGQLNPGGEADVVRIQGTPGQRLRFDRLTITNEIFANWLLFGPGDQTWGGDFGSVPDFTATLASSATYLLALGGRGAPTIDYSYQLLDSSDPPATTSGFGNLETGSLAANASQTFTYNAAADTRVYLDIQDRDFQKSFSLVGPENTVVFSSNLDQGPWFLPRAGQYTLTVRASNSATNYRFRLLDAGAAAVAPLNSVVSGTLDPEPRTDAYRLQGTAGQRWLFNDRDSSIFLQFFSPSGANLSAAISGDNPRPFTLSESGDYLLFVNSSSFGGQPVTYSFEMTDLSTTQPVGFDTPVTIQLPTGHDTRLFQFQGTAGQRLYFDSLVEDLPFDAGRWSLIAPGNQSPTDSLPSLNSDFVVTLPLTATYVLALVGHASTATEVRFQITTPRITTAALTLGETVTGTLDKPGDRADYTFQGTVGQSIYFDALPQGSTLGASFTLTSPSGEQLFVGERQLILEENGSYRFGVGTRDESFGLIDATGTYQFRLLDLSTAPLLTLGVEQSGQLNPGQSATAFRFRGNSGDRLYFDDLLENSQASYQIFIDGLIPTVEFIGFGADRAITLGGEGTYYLVVEGSNSSGPSNYRFRLTKPPTTSFPFVPGADTLGTLTVAGERHIYSFLATAGEQPYFDGLDQGNAGLPVTILDPLGTVLRTTTTSADAALAPLPYTGRYRVQVGGADDVGAYRFRILPAESLAELTFGQPVSGQIAPRTASVFRLNGTAGERWFIDVQASANANTGTLLVYGPSGLVERSNSLVFDLSFDVSSTGTYLIALQGDNFGTATIDYQLRVVKPTTTQAGTLALDTTINGTLAGPGDRLVYTFAGTTNQRLYLNGLTTGGAPIVEIRDPNNAFFQSGTAGGNRGPLQLFTTGTYQVIVGNSDYVGPFSFRLLDLATAPTITSGQTVSGRLELAKEADVYVFQGTAGQQGHFIGLLGTGTARVEIFRPNNNRQVLGFTTGDFTFALPQTGTYVLVVELANAAEDYSFRLEIGSPLRLDHTEPAAAGVDLTPDSLPFLLQAAVTAWTAAGLDAEQNEQLRNVLVAVADLPEDLLGWTVGNQVWLDRDAAGAGWFVDPTPETADDLAGRVDALTALIHELGHVLGRDHEAEGVLAEALLPGERRLPVTQAVDWLFQAKDA